MNYIEFFKKSVQKNANKIALVYKDKKISYDELDILSSKVADKLHKMGAKKGDFIAVFLQRSIEYVASYLGILKAGMVVVPLSLKYPQQRVDFIQKNCNAFAIIKEDFFKDIDEFEFFEDLGTNSDPALLLYTSGSTGNPKGILHTNYSLFFGVKRSIKFMKECKNRFFASVCEFSFVVFIHDYLAGFCQNLEVHIIPDDIKLEPKLLQKYYKNNKIYGATMPPSFLSLFEEKPAVKILFTGGEKLSNIYFKGLKIYFLYAMSEVFMVTAFNVDKKYDNAPVNAANTCGVKLKIVDEKGKELKNGEIGEIVISGDFEQKYFKDDEKSAKTFIKNKNKTLVFSGDLGYKNKNGDIIITGRKDWMVKIHGQRVEIYEIESILSKIKDIKECAIKAFGKNDKYLVAFVGTAKSLDVGFIKNELAKKLPAYMLPKYFIFMEKLPKNINGKIDRNSLKEPQNYEIADKKDFLEPKNSDEKELCAIFEKILKCKKVGLNDDFSILGGDSLSATQIASSSKLKGINPSLIIKEKTPLKIINACKNIKKLDNKNKSIELTPTQLYMYFAYDPKCSFYYLPFYTKLPNDVDLKRFKAALSSAFKAHKIFCARIKNKNSKLCFFYKKEKLKLGFEKIQNLESFIPSFIKPFDLERDRLYKFCICECENGDKYLVFNIHHVIFDGISLGVFMSDIAGFYNGKKIKPESYAFSLNYNKLLKNREKERFSHKIANIDCAPKGDINGTNSNEFLVKKEIKNSKEILNFLNKNKITPDSFFISIYALSLFEISKSDECELLYSSASRYHNDLKNSVGMFVESFPIHFDKTDFKNLYATKDLYVAHSTFLSSLDVSNIKIGYVYEDDLIGDIDFNGNKLKMILIDRELKRSKLFLTIFKDKERFCYYLHYNRNIYSKEFIQNFCELYEGIISEFLNGKREIWIF